jgi:hypothetical protein
MFQLSLKDLKELIIGESTDLHNRNIGKICLIRTYSAGVHFGRLEECSSCVTVVRLSNARRIWSWNGANTLSEIANSGVSCDSKISEEVESITISGVIEIIPMTDRAITCFEEIKWS